MARWPSRRGGDGTVFRVGFPSRPGVVIAQTLGKGPGANCGRLSLLGRGIGKNMDLREWAGRWPGGTQGAGAM